MPNFRYWDPKCGAFSTSNSLFHDVDDTAVCFMNLRLHGYQISPGKFLYVKIIISDKIFVTDQVYYSSVGVRNLIKEGKIQSIEK